MFCYSKQNSFGFLVALDSSEEAYGDLYIDDGDSAGILMLFNLAILAFINLIIL